VSTQAEAGTTAQLILDATLQVLGEKGIKGATTPAIAQAAGVHEVTLFRNFGNKTNLIQAALADRAAIVEREAVRYTGDIEADLIHLAENYHAALEAFGPSVRVVLTEAPTAAEFVAVRDVIRQLFAAISGLLARYQQEGQLHPEPPETLVPAFLAPVALPYLVPTPPIEGVRGAFDARTHVNRFLNGRARR
jgi:AcrR family transcriptional regulator